MNAYRDIHTDQSLVVKNHYSFRDLIGQPSTYLTYPKSVVEETSHLLQQMVFVIEDSLLQLKNLNTSQMSSKKEWYDYFPKRRETKEKATVN